MSQDSFSYPPTPSVKITYRYRYVNKYVHTYVCLKNDYLILLTNVCCTMFSFQNVIHLESPSNKDINKEITQTLMS